MGDRDLPSPLIALVASLLGLAALAQGDGLRVPDEHRRAVRAERSARFFAAWRDADASARAATAAVIHDLGGEHRPSGRFPRLAELTAATRVLEGRAAAADDPIQRLADRIDLRVVPGIVPARDDGRGESLVVHVSLLAAIERPDEVRLSLLWRGPDGGEQHALGEPFAGSAFANGFAMFPRAPLGVEGAFELVPVIEHDGQVARGSPVPVPIVPAASAEIDARLTGAGHAAAGWTRALLRQRVTGERSAIGISTDEAVAELMGGQGALTTFASRLRDVEGAGGVRLRSVSYGDGTSPLLLFVAPSTEAPAAVLSGPVGDAWRAFGERRGLVLCAASVDPGADEPLTRVFDAARTLSSGPLVVVARGDAHTILTFAHLRDPAAFDALVVSSDDGFIGKRLPAVPTLLVAPAGVGEGARPAHVTRVDGGPSAFLSELELPERIDGWIDALEPADGD